VRIVTWLLVVAGLVLAAFGVMTAVGQAGSGAQPWSTELSDNFVFVKALPFVLAFGFAVGMLMARTYGPKVRSDGAVRRWSPGTVFGHWTLTLGFVLALPTGMWQYLGGILDVNLPIPIYLFYRVHYIGASVVVFAVAAFTSYLWMTGDRSLLVPRGQWSRHLLGLAYELPPRIRGPYAKLFRIDLSQPRPPTGKFSFYEKVVEFPSWSILLALITITGLVKAARYVVPVPGFGLWVASTLHVAAMVGIVIKLLDHLRYTFPRWPLMASIATTWVKEGSAPPRRQGAAERGGSTAGVAGGGDS
jgi:cytochrome b subunit of formate dehydrogenase